MILYEQIHHFRKIATEMFNYGIITLKEYLKIRKKIDKIEEKSRRNDWLEKN